MMTTQRVARGLLVILALSPAAAAQAVNYWKNSVVAGNWNTGSNWSATSAAGVDDAGAPTAGEAVNIAFIDGTARTVAYDVAAPTIGILSIDLIGVGTTTSTLSLTSNHNLTSNGIAVGGYNGAALTNGRGAITQSAGTITTSPAVADLILGWGAGSTGVYTLSGGALVNNLNEYVGLAGTGTFNQSGGSNTINASAAGFLSVGHNAGSTGTYNLSGSGALVTNASQNIGNSGTGVFNQTGGTNTITGAGHHLYLGRNASGVGTYTLSGTAALFSAGDVIVGSNGSGTLTIQDQASVYVTNNLSIKSFSSVSLNGGTLRFNTVGGSAGLNNLFYTVGTIQLAGNRDIGFDSTIATLFGAVPVIASNKSLTIEGNTDVLTNLTVNGGTLTGQSGVFRVGGGANGSLAVTGGGRVVSNVTSYIGVSSGIVGSVNVSGPGSSWTVNGDLWIGVEGTGSMNVMGGGTVTTTGFGFIAYDLSSPFTTVGNVLVSGPGSTWTIGNGLVIGGPAGAGVLTIEDQGMVYVTTGIQIDNDDALNLNGGTIRFDTFFDLGGVFNFNSGTIQLAGNRTLGTDAVIQQHFGSVPVIPAGKGLTVEGAATISSAVTLNGGTLRANNLVVNGVLHFGGGLLELTGGTITGLSSLTIPSSGEFRASGVQSLRITGAAGSTITATGNLTLGNVAAVNGFGTQGTLQVGANTVTLLDANDVVFDSLSLTTLGSGPSSGTLSAANGLTLDFGGNLTGFGTVTTPNNVTKPLINNGHITGNSGAQRITLPGYVKGAGTFDNVNFTGTFSPGLSPALTIVGSITLTPTSTLIMELGGTGRGGEYDAILASGNLGLGGAMNVTLIDGFNPALGHAFDLFDWNTLSGTFASINLPTLTAGLAWNMSLLYSTGVLQVVTPGFQAADFDEDGDVDGADLTRWRSNFGTGATHMQGNADGDGDVDGADFLTWQRQLGVPPSVVAAAAVPEPSALVLVAVVGCGRMLRRRGNRMR